jgi:ferredoxin-type protein NapH
MNAAPKPRAAHAPARGPVRHFVLPPTLRGRLWAWRFGIARRLVQGAVLLLFFGTLHWGFKLLGQPLLAGNLSAASLAGTVPLADPFAVLQALAARHPMAAEALLGAGITTALYALLGGRVFCAWVCPMNMVTDAAAWSREQLGLATTRDLVSIPPRTRYGVLGLSLAVSAAAGLAAFEAFSPIAMLHRELIYGAGMGLSAAAGIFLLDTFVLRRGWCGHLCPLGAFWALVGSVPGLGQLKVVFDDSTCTHCGDCVKACPEPRVLHFADLAQSGCVASGECTSCGRCVAVCPESSLKFDLRVRIHPAALQAGAAAPPVSGGTP